jgi:hypothetical protein
MAKCLGDCVLRKDLIMHSIEMIDILVPEAGIIGIFSYHASRILKA